MMHCSTTTLQDTKRKEQQRMDLAILTGRFDGEVLGAVVASDDILKLVDEVSGEVVPPGHRV